MNTKEIPEDFRVDELYDLEQLSQKDEGKGPIYHYCKLIKTNYSQMKALEQLSRLFKINRRQIHFSGSKDKFAITSQLISFRDISKERLMKTLEYINSDIKDLELEYIGVFHSRLNLGDNLGNRFTVVLRDLGDFECDKVKKSCDLILKKGILNLFGKQRFGFAKNSHIIGKYLLQNKIKDAVFEILTALPQDPSPQRVKVVEYLQSIREEIGSDKMKEALRLLPEEMYQERGILEFLERVPTDFAGAFRTLHKKQRSLYVHAYQSFIFNEAVKKLDSSNELPEELELVTAQSSLDGTYKKLVEKQLSEDELGYESFLMPHMRELALNEKNMRKTRVFPRNVEVLETGDDELHENKMKITLGFELGSGEYATQVLENIELAIYLNEK